MFSELEDAELSALVKECSVVDLEPGEVLFEEGAVGDAAYVVQSGQIDILKRSGSRAVRLSELKPGDLFGEMALLDDSPRMAGARANGGTKVVSISKSDVQALLQKSRVFQSAMFDLVLARLKSTEAQLRQSERMVQLGTLTAGIAHELNNPAAAAKRSVDQLAEAVATFSAAYGELAVAESNESTIALANELIDQARARALKPNEMDPFEQSDAESVLGDWLEDNGVEDSWNISCDIVAAGYSRNDLERWAEANQTVTSIRLARLVSSVISVSTLLASVGQATSRISDIVDALKSYSFLDQAPIQRVDITEGIDQTLALMGSRIGSDVKLVKQFEPNIPVIDARGSEINQVWTNLLNNAIDAVDGDGEIKVSVRRSVDGGVTVEVFDSGHGIPADIQDRIFDAFFTTREPGHGTGLGLHTAYDIVVNKHQGTIAVDSLPGDTTFTVTLPSTQQGD